MIRDRLDAGEWEPPEHPPAPPRDGQMTLLAPVIDIGTGTAVVNTSDDSDDDAAAAAGDDADESDTPDAAADDAPGATPDETLAAEAGRAESAGASTQPDAAVDAPSASGVPSTEGEDRGMALTIDEMADASGCDVAMIRELERFGLIAGRSAGPAVLYDVDSLTIARHAAQFRTYGLDPRHLRTFLVGAQREVSLLAQVVEPLRHRRDPETRRKSVETMEDLTDLAASLRAILMRRITEEQLPNR